MPHFVTESFRLLKRYGPPALREQFSKIVDRHRPIAATTEIKLDDIQELFSLVSGQHPQHQALPNHDEARCLRAVIAHTLCYSELENRYRMAGFSEALRPTRSEITHHASIEKWNMRDDQKSRQTKASLTVPIRHLFPPNNSIMSYDTHPDLPPLDHLLNCSVYDAFLSYILFRSEVSVESENHPTYTDVVITPNYDLVLERAADNRPKCCAIDYGESVDDKSSSRERGPKLRLIKLHGSLNWQPHEKGDKCAWKLWKPIEEVGKWDTESDDPELVDKFNRIPLIPPTWENDGINGNSLSAAPFAALRRDAIHHLKTAERIVIIGYSMPKTDLNIRYLMAHALNTPERPEIEVWDIKPKAEMLDAIETMFGKNLAASVKYAPDDFPQRKEGGLTGYVRSHLRP